jgi:hypothetical protein
VAEKQTVGSWPGSRTVGDRPSDERLGPVPVPAEPNAVALAGGTFSAGEMVEIDLLSEWDGRTGPCLVAEPASPSPSLWGMRHADAGLASYTAGLVAAAAFMALSLGPGWVGFLVGFLPASLLTSWAVASHA